MTSDGQDRTGGRRARPVWRRWLSRLVVAAVVAGGVAVPAADAPVAHANPSSLFDMTQWTVLSQSAVSRWNDGTGLQYGTYSVAVTWQGKSTTPLLVPTVGDVFYVHIYTEVYNVWSASYQMKVLLPAGLQLAPITPSQDVFCGVTDFGNNSVRLMPECADPVVISPYVVFPTVASNINERLHFFFPVVATAPLNGATMQVLSDQSNSPAVSLPDPTLTEHTIYVLAAATSATAPAAPTSLAASPADRSASISFTAGSNGGAIISNYQYSLDGGAWTSLSPADGLSPVTIPGLANGTTYGVRLRAVNSVGVSAASASVSVTPRTTPSAPTALSATPGNGSATVAFTAGSNGGAAITNYQYSTNGGSTWAALSPADNASPVTVPGLTNGTTYNVSLRAVNAAGAGVSSAQVSVTPRTVAPAPTGLSATAGNRSATVSFTQASTGGAAISNYQYSVNGGVTWTALSPADAASPVTVPGLTNGITYGISLRAVNAAGVGAASAAVSVRPVGPPAAPTALVGVGGNGAASISFTAGSNGGAPITNYQYSLGGGAWTSLSPADAVSPITIGGLVNGTTYAVRLRAINSYGSGTASAPVSVTATAVKPSAPTRLVASPRNGAAIVAFRPGANGGATITNYQYSVDNGAWKALSPADGLSPIRIPGLTNGVLHSIRIRAVNAKGAGAVSAAVSVRPSATAVVPGAPTYLTAKASPTGTSATLTFWPGSDGGAAITNYLYSLNNGAWKALSPADAASPITITGLAKGTAYSIRIRAVNVKGAGTASAGVSVTMPATVPGTPTNLVPGAVQLAVFNPITMLLFFEFHGTATWSAPASNGGSPITGYTVRWWDAPSGGNVVQSCTTTGTTCNSPSVVTLFTNYYVDVVATNALGNSVPTARVLWHL